MTDGLDLVHGSRNVFRDFCRPHADVEQMKAILAAQIIQVLDDRDLAARAAEDVMGFAAADFSRIRRAKFDRTPLTRRTRKSTPQK